MPDVVWTPDAATLERANVVRLMRRHGFDDYRDARASARSTIRSGSGRRRSRTWASSSSSPGQQVRRSSRAGPSGRRGSSAASSTSPGTASTAGPRERPTTTAAVFRGEDGARRELTFAELSTQVTRLAEALVRLGVEPGDRVAIYLPMSPEVAIASHACAHIGAVQVPIFSGFAAPAVAQRLAGLRGEGRDHRRDARCAAAARSRCSRSSRRRDARRRRSSTSSSRPSTSCSRTARGARAARRRLGASRICSRTRPARPARRRACSTSRAASSSRSRARSATRPTRGPGDVIHFATDMGWIMGPWTVVGGGAMGATIVYAEGAPDWPRRPALAARRGGARDDPRLLPDAHPRADPARRCREADLSSLRIIVTTGEPWNPDPYRWLFEHGRRRPLPDHQLLRRNRGRRLLPLADAARCRSRSARVGGPALGMAMDVVDDDGRSLVGDGRGRRARLPQAVPRHDARLLARPRAVPRHVLAPLPGHLDARRLGVGRRGRLLVPPRPLRRHAQHRRQADRARRDRVGGRRHIRRWPRRRRSASRTTSRARWPGCSACSRPGERGVGRARADAA